ncbi:MAG: hypothetical protein AB1427_08720 [Thermodesulfobacteriota bacterium]
MALNVRELYNPQRSAILGRFTRTSVNVADPTMRRWPIPAKPAIQSIMAAPKPIPGPDPTKVLSSMINPEGRSVEDRTPEPSITPDMTKYGGYLGLGIGNPGSYGGVTDLPQNPVTWDDVKTPLSMAGLTAASALTAGAPIAAATAAGMASGIKYKTMVEPMAIGAKKLYTEYVDPFVKKNIIDPAKKGLGVGGEPIDIQKNDSRSIPGTVTQGNIEANFPGPGREGSQRGGLYDAGTATQKDLEKSFPGPDPDKSSESNDEGSPDDSVLCSELFRQGYLPETWYRADQAYAQKVAPEVVAGYHIWAKPLVRQIRKRKWLLHLARVFVTPWAKHMAFKMQVIKRRSVFGAFLEFVGIPLCRTLYWFSAGWEVAGCKSED